MWNQIWEQLNKFPLTCSSFKCPVVKKLFRENSAEKICLLQKQTQHTNTVNWVQITEPISAWKFFFHSPPGEIYTRNLQSTLVFCIALKVVRIFLVAYFFLEAVGAKWGRQQRERLLESKLNREKQVSNRMHAVSNEPINFRETRIIAISEIGLFHLLCSV